MEEVNNGVLQSMLENNNEEKTSLFEEVENKLEEQQASMLDNDSSEAESDNSSSETLGFIGSKEDTTSGATEVDVEALAAEQEKQRIIREHNERIMKSPEYRAQVVFENYVQTCGRILSGPEKRNLKRQFLRNAKKGMYDYLFDEEKAKKREERMRAKFEKMNKPKVHTVDEIPENVKKDLLDMVDLSTNDIVDDRNS